MLWVKLKNGLPVDVRHRFPGELKLGEWDGSWQNRCDWTSFEEVQRIAAYVTAVSREDYVGIDEGDCCSPRYDVVRAPRVGDLVSYGFNGDSYPDGEIVSVSKTMQVITSTGKRYRRRGKTGTWLRTGGTWSLIHGHISERNPHF